MPQKKVFADNAIEIQRNLLEKEETQMAGSDNVREEEYISGLLSQRNRRGEGLRPRCNKISRRVRQPEFPAIPTRQSLVNGVQANPGLNTNV